MAALSPLFFKKNRLEGLGTGLALVLPLAAQIAILFDSFIPALCVFLAAVLRLLSPWRGGKKGARSRRSRITLLRNLAVLPALSLLAAWVAVSFPIGPVSALHSLRILLNAVTILFSGLVFAGELRTGRLVFLRARILGSRMSLPAKDFFLDLLALSAAILCLPRFLARSFAELRARGRVAGGRKTPPLKGIVAAFGACLRELADDIFVRL